MTEHSQLYFNGVIRTLDKSAPLVEAVAVRGGQILAAGTNKACETILGKSYEPVDLQGCAMLPGFIDTHLHPVLLIFYRLNCDLGAARSIGEVQQALEAALLKKSGDSWLVGLNYDEQNMREKRVPDRHDLDRVSGDRPVIVVKHDGHSVFAITRAIEAAGLTASTPTPEAGIIERENDGYPSGVFRELAVPLILNSMPMPEMDVLIEGARQTFSYLASLGLTSLGVVLQTGEEGPAGSAGSFDIPAMQLFSEHCPQSLYSLLVTSDVSSLSGLRESVLNRGAHRLGGLKLFADGTFGSSTAYMF